MNNIRAATAPTRVHSIQHLSRCVVVEIVVPRQIHLVHQIRQLPVQVRCVHPAWQHALSRGRTGASTVCSRALLLMRKPGDISPTARYLIRPGDSPAHNSVLFIHWVQSFPQIHAVHRGTAAHCISKPRVLAH